MKRLALFITAVSISTCLNAQTPHDWENPAVLSINKLPYHATLQLPSKEKECKEIVSLDGQWLFHWSRNPEERPAELGEDYRPWQLADTRLRNPHLLQYRIPFQA